MSMSLISPHADLFDLARVIVGVILLGYASYSDWKVRRVVNRVWYIMCGAGILILEIQFAVAGAPFAFYLSPIIAFLIFLLVIHDGVLFFDHPSWALKLGATIPAYLATVGMIVYQWQTLYGRSPLFIYMIAMYLMILIARLMYDFRLLHGGADAKAIMALAIFLPFLPRLSATFPILQFNIEPAKSIYLYVEPMFPPAIVVLFNAVVFFIFAPLAFFIYNAVHGDIKLPQSFFGYTMDRDEVPDKFVWLMERWEDGKRRSAILRRDDSPIEEQLEPFVAADIGRVWVTPKLPFMIPILLGYILVFVVGNIMFGLVLALGG